MAYFSCTALLILIVITMVTCMFWYLKFFCHSLTVYSDWTIILTQIGETYMVWLLTHCLNSLTLFYITLLFTSYGKNLLTVNHDASAVLFYVIYYDVDSTAKYWELPKRWWRIVMVIFISLCKLKYKRWFIVCELGH